MAEWECPYCGKINEYYPEGDVGQDDIDEAECGNCDENIKFKLDFTLRLEIIKD